MVGSYHFSHSKKSARAANKIEIKFTNSSLLTDTLSVNKLLKQNLNQQSKQFKESLDLNMLETQLKQIPEVKNIEIYKFPQGDFYVEVTKRKPLFEVLSDKHFFADSEGILFEYRSIDSLKLPVFVMDSTVPSVVQTADLISKLKNYPLLEMELETIYLNENEYIFKLRSFPFDVILGDSSRLNQKIQKLKVFCAFQISQDSLNEYELINLSYKNQVVASIL
jgi:cell division protein FtsQ